MAFGGTPDKQDVFQVFGATLRSPDRLLYPRPEETDQAVTAVFSSLRRRSDHTNITLADGAFDVPHDGHEWMVRHTRALGAAASLIARGIEPTPDMVRNMLISPDVITAITVDADHKVAHVKSGFAEKGGVQRPIYPWQARADRVAGYTFETAPASGLYVPTTDLVTVEGDHVHRGTALESFVSLAIFLAERDLLDNVVINKEHSAALTQATEAGLNPIVINPDDMPFGLNPQTDRPWSSSDLIRRAQGEPVPHPITSPLD